MKIEDSRFLPHPVPGCEGLFLRPMTYHLVAVLDELADAIDKGSTLQELNRMVVRRLLCGADGDAVEGTDEQIDAVVPLQLSTVVMDLAHDVCSLEEDSSSSDPTR